jgi:hypothetical protein
MNESEDKQPTLPQEFVDESLHVRNAIDGLVQAVSKRVNRQLNFLLEVDLRRDVTFVSVNQCSGSLVLALHEAVDILQHQNIGPFSNGYYACFSNHETYERFQKNKSDNRLIEKNPEVINWTSNYTRFAHVFNIDLFCNGIAGHHIDFSKNRRFDGRKPIAYVVGRGCNIDPDIGDAALAFEGMILKGVVLDPMFIVKVVE